MSSNWVCCSNNSRPSWQTANNASLSKADALLFHGFQQSLMLVSHLIKFIYSTNSWKQLTQDKDLLENTLTDGQVYATIQCYIISPTQSPRDGRRHQTKSPFQHGLLSFHGAAAEPLWSWPGLQKQCLDYTLRWQNKLFKNRNRQQIS